MKFLGAVAALLTSLMLLLAGGVVAVSPASAASTHGAPVVLLSINPISNSQPEVPVATKAAVDAINKAGGIKGHPLQVINCDDSAGVNADAACAREAVSDHALAVVGVNTAGGPTYLPIISAAGIPDVGVDENTANENASTDTFPLGGGSTVSLTGWGALQPKIGCKHIGLLSADVSVLETLAKQYYYGVKLSGGGKVKTVLVPLTATDYTPYVSTFASEADCGSDITSGNIAEVIINELYQAGWPGYFVYGLSEFSQADVTQLGPAAKHLILTSTYAPITDNSIPGIKQFNDEVNATGNHSVPRDENMLNMWVSIHVVAQEAQKLPSITPAALTHALRTGGTVSYKGVFHPVNFAKPSPISTPAQRIFNTYVTYDKVVNGKIVPLFGGNFVNVLKPSTWGPVGKL